MSMLFDAIGAVGDAMDRPGAAVRGLLAGRPKDLAYLVPGAETFGLVDPAQKVTGADLLGKVGVDPDSWMGQIGGMGVEMATNPLSYLGGAGVKAGWGALKGAFGSRAAPAIGAAAEAATGAGGSRTAAMLGARRTFPMAMDVDPMAGTMGRVLGGGNRQGAGRVAGNLLDQAEQAAMQYGPKGGPQIEGMFDLGERAGALMKDTSPITRRHEVIHGLVDTALNSGNSQGMPPLVRLAAAVGRDTQPNTVRAGAGALLDELAAQTYGNKGMWNQAKGAGEFLFGGPKAVRQNYADLFSQQSPLVGAIYKNLPYAPYAAAAGLGGAGVGGAYLGGAFGS